MIQKKHDILLQFLLSCVYSFQHLSLWNNAIIFLDGFLGHSVVFGCMPFWQKKIIRPCLTEKNYGSLVFLFFLHSNYPIGKSCPLTYGCCLSPMCFKDSRAQNFIQSFVVVLLLQLVALRGISCSNIQLYQDNCLLKCAMIFPGHDCYKKLTFLTTQIIHFPIIFELFGIVCVFTNGVCFCATQSDR